MLLNLTTDFLETLTSHPLQHSGKIALAYDMRYVLIYDNNLRIFLKSSILSPLPCVSSSSAPTLLP